MTPEDILMIRQVLPEDMAFPYYADRESPWLLAQLMPDQARVADLRAATFGKLLNRPLVQPLVARCGGALARRDVWAVAHADRAMRLPVPGGAGLAGLEAAFAQPWQDFGLSFDAWGTAYDLWNQTSRKGGNLVIQLGFPSDHADLMGRFAGGKGRKDFEFDMHPIRTTGRPTLAWARVDVDLASGHALIEEVQSDWLRNVRDEVDYVEYDAPRSRELAQLRAYEAGLLARYGKIWPRAMLLATLMLLRDEFACRTVWMHQPKAGAIYKGIDGVHPPRSLYTSLPKSFCFEPTQAVPPFLQREKRRKLRRLGAKEPLFWRLGFTM